MTGGNPFGALEDENAHRIERIGHPFASPPGWMGRHERPLSFAERQTYYMWYCIRLASALGINYAPSPIRVPLVTTPGFMDVKAFPDFAGDLVEYFGKVRQEYVAGLAEASSPLARPSICRSSTTTYDPRSPVQSTH